MSSEFIKGLVATAEPVAPRRAYVDGLAVLLLGVIQMVGLSAFFDAETLARAYAAEPTRMIFKIGTFGVASVVFSALAIQSFSPGAQRHGTGLWVTIAAVAIGLGLWADWSLPNGVFAALDPMHGTRCVMAVSALSLPTILTLSLLMLRGAPVYPRRSSALVGLAGGSFGAFLFAFQCPEVSTYYLGVWYIGAVALAGIATTLVLPRIVRW